MGVFNKGVILVGFYIIAVIQAAMSTTEEVVKREKDKILSTRRQMECVEEVRVDPELVVNVRIGHWKDENALLKQWVLCVLMKAGLMTREGVYRLDVAMDKAPEEHKNHIESLIDRCLSQKAIPAPIIAYNFAKCYQRLAKGNFTFASIF